MELYMQNKENGRMILESVEHGPLIWPIIEENGLPLDVYSLVNHHKVAKDLWETVQLLMQEQFQVNTKFLNSLLPEWSKFVSDVKISPHYGSTHPTQHYSTTYPSTSRAITYPSTSHPNAYSSTVHQDACPQPQSISQIEYTVSTVNQQMHLAEFPQIDSGLAGRQSSFAAGTSGTRTNNSGIRGNNSGQQRVVKCFNCHGEGHMTRQCLKPKRKRDATWFRDKVLLVKAQGSSKVLNEEELEFLADLRVAEGPVTQTIITQNAAYQADDLDAYDSDCDNFSIAKAVLMANLSSYESYVLSEDNLIPNESLSTELERYKERVKLLEERKNVDLSTREKLIMDDIIREKHAQFMNFEKKINYLKQTLFEQSKENELLTKTFNVFKNKSKEKEAQNIDKEISLEKKVKELDNIVCKIGQSAQNVHMLMKLQVFYDDNLKQALGFQNPFYLKKAQQIRPMLYDGNVIAKETNVISIADSEESLMLEEESQSKMLLKQSDPVVLEKKVNIKTINYDELNRLSEDFGKSFVPQQELSNEQAFQLRTSDHNNTDQSTSSPVKIEALQELSKVSLVNTSLKKLKYNLGQFDNVVKKRITPDALTEGE
uniref:CCHC-type domain-containing protein n=1 Tax=Tanacetum cinerariifolium TaxID=118510 RepID=A0A699I675_TANCI|nr:hypothetical protein [Tanacetum cinerariifolium]